MSSKYALELLRQNFNVNNAVTKDPSLAAQMTRSANGYVPTAEEQLKMAIADTGVNWMGFGQQKIKTIVNNVPDIVYGQVGVNTVMAPNDYLQAANANRSVRFTAPPAFTADMLVPPFAAKTRNALGADGSQSTILASGATKQWPITSTDEQYMQMKAATEGYEEYKIFSWKFALEQYDPEAVQAYKNGSKVAAIPLHKHPRHALDVGNGRHTQLNKAALDHLTQALSPNLPNNPTSHITLANETEMAGASRNLQSGAPNQFTQYVLPVIAASEYASPSPSIGGVGMNIRARERRRQQQIQINKTDRHAAMSMSRVGVNEGGNNVGGNSQNPFRTEDTAGILQRTLVEHGGGEVQNGSLSKNEATNFYYDLREGNRFVSPQNNNIAVPGTPSYSKINMHDGDGYLATPSVVKSYEASYTPEVSPGATVARDIYTPNTGLEGLEGTAIATKVLSRSEIPQVGDMAQKDLSADLISPEDEENITFNRGPPSLSDITQSKKKLKKSEGSQISESGDFVSSKEAPPGASYTKAKGLDFGSSPLFKKKQKEHFN